MNNSTEHNTLILQWREFFDYLSIKWVEVPADPTCNRVIPLWLPDYSLEVQVTTEAPTEDELIDAGLHRDFDGHAVVVFSGYPTQNNGTLYCWDTSDSSGGIGEWDVSLADNPRHPGTGMLFFIGAWCYGRNLYSSDDFHFELPVTDCGDDEFLRSIAGIVLDPLPPEPPPAPLVVQRKPVSLKSRYLILKRDGYKCRYCGRFAGQVPIEIDHITPVAKGGTNDHSNLCVACADCNRGKGAL